MASNALSGFLKGFSDQTVKEKDEDRKREAAREERIAAEKRGMNNFRQKLEIQDSIYTQRDERKKEAAKRLAQAEGSYYSRAWAGEDVTTLINEAANDVDFPIALDSAELIRIKKERREANKTPADVDMDSLVRNFNRFKLTNPDDPTTLADFANMRGGSKDPVAIDKETGKALQKQIRSFSSVNRGLNEMKELSEFAGYGQSTRSDISGKARQIGSIAGSITGNEGLASAGESVGQFFENDEQRKGFAAYTSQKNIMIGRINDTVAMLGRLSDFDARTILTAIEGVEGASDPMTIQSAIEQIQKELRMGAKEALKALRSKDVVDTISPEDYNALMELSGAAVFEGSQEEQIEQYKALPPGSKYWNPAREKWEVKPNK